MVNVGYEGYYKITAKNADTGVERVLADWFPNVITNAGLNAAGLRDTFTHFQLGTGTVAPSTSSTGLTNSTTIPKYAIGVTSGATTTAPFYKWKRWSAVYNAGEITGNFSEIAFGYPTTVDNTSPLNAFSHTLITENGTPITITVLESDYLTVQYELRAYVKTTDVTGTISVMGNTHNYTIRSARATNTTSASFFDAPFMMFQSNSATDCVAYSGAISASIENSPAGAISHATSFTRGAYSNNSLTATGTATFAVSVANFETGIKSIEVNTTVGGAFQIEFTPAIMKTANDALTFSFSTTWGRHEP